MIAVFLAALLAFCLSVVCGGGAGLLLLPVLNSVLLPAQVPAALSLGTTFSSLSRWALFRSFIRWDVSRCFIPAALPGAVAGALLLSYLNPLYIEAVMAVFLISNLPLVFRPPATTSEAGALSRLKIIAVGFLTGFVSGLTGAVGLLFNGFYLRGGMSKNEIVATRAANEGLLHLFKLALYLALGLLSQKALSCGLCVAVAATLASWIMRRGLSLVPERLFQRLGYGAMVVSGFVLLGSAGQRLGRQHRVRLDYALVSQGLDTQVQWGESKMLALELRLGEGLEVEQRVPFSHLPLHKQQQVTRRQGGSEARCLFDEVWTLTRHYHEVYQLDPAGRVTEKYEI